MTNGNGPVTTKSVKEWLPIILSIVAVFFAYTNQQQEMEVRLTVLEIAVQSQDARLEQVEADVRSIRAKYQTPNTNPSNPNF